ncbi:MAG TPA: hypothetical protein GXZ93_04320 [Actinobacteria bacterium]|nr:hypothetical protein [Actinomycetota bacterium]
MKFLLADERKRQSIIAIVIKTGATDSTENCMNKYGNFGNKGSLNGEGNKEGIGNNGKK